MSREKKNIVELTRWSVEEYRSQRKRPLLVMADNVRSLHNVGSLFRTGDAFGIAGLILGGITGTPPHPELSKSALGAEESVAWRHVDDCVEECRRLKGEGWRILALEQAHDSIPLPAYHPDRDERMLLVVGNEVEGVDQRIVSMADAVLEIPQYGIKHSLNVSVSAGIAIYSLLAGELHESLLKK